MDHDKFLKFIGPLSFKIADKFFKFVSWAFLIVAVRYVYAVTKDDNIRYLDYLSTNVFATALFIQAIYTFGRDPETLGVPKEFHGISRVIQIIIGLLMSSVLISPYLYTDRILEAILQARLK